MRSDWFAVGLVPRNAPASRNPLPAPAFGFWSPCRLPITNPATCSPQNVPLTGVGQDFSLTPGSQATATVSPGQTATYAVTIAPGGGFSQTVALSCSGAPAQATCSVSPSSVKLSGSAATATVTVTTTGTSAGLTQPINTRDDNIFGSLASSGTLGLAILLSLAGGRKANRSRLLYGLTAQCVLSIGVTMSACGGGSGSSSAGLAIMVSIPLAAETSDAGTSARKDSVSQVTKPGHFAH
jgi:hypothetical protein